MSMQIWLLGKDKTENLKWFYDYVLRKSIIFEPDNEEKTTLLKLFILK